ncbi:MAG: right-handed parallel beta-helix repeat-containing protein [Isosphaeraceae bacterium]
MLSRSCLSLAAMFVALPTIAFAQNLYMAPDGRDAWSGTLARPNADRTDGPVATLAGARDAARHLRVSSTTMGAIRIAISDGTYFLTEPVVFAPEDSGKAGSPTVYEAEPGAHPLFSGGRRIDDLRIQGGRWIAELPDVRAGSWTFEQLFVNGRRATRARTPNEGYFPMIGRVPRGTDPSTGRDADLSRQAFRYREGDLEEFANLRDVQVIAYHSWEVSRHRLASVDESKRVAVLTGPAAWPFFQWEPNQRYHVENLAVALDSPGEWFLARDGKLTYLPLPGERAEAAEVVAPIAPALLRLEGKPESNRFVEHLEFRGLSFRHSQYLTPDRGQSDHQSAISMPSAIALQGARSIRFDACEVAHVGGHAIHFERGCTDCAVVNSYLHDLGAGGVRIGETKIRPEGPERTGRCSVENSIIRGYGRIDAGGCGVWIGQSGDNRIVHNDIADGFYTAVSVGWTWGYGPSLAANNRIDFNRLHHLGWGVLSDMAGVYTLGVRPGTTVNHNVVHDVESYSYGGWGLYNDEGSTRVQLRDNLTYRTKSGGYHQHYGRENTVENNIFADSRDHQIQLTRPEDHLSITFRGNIVAWKGGTLLDGRWLEAKVGFDHNLYWNSSGKPVQFAGKSLDEWQALGRDAGSIISDPRFIDPTRDDYRLQDGSPAREIGFEPFNASEAGVRRGANPWSSTLELPLPAMEAASDPAVTIDESFEFDPVGSTPGFAQIRVEGKGDAVRVTDRVAAGGRHSLEVIDAPGLLHRYDPHLFIQPHLKKGRARCSFDLRLETEVDIQHEWRSGGLPYRVGPTIRVQGRNLTAPGGVSVELPLREWIHLELIAGFGADRGPTWSLSIRPKTGASREWLHLAFGSSEWDRLDWEGFSSQADGPTTFQLDNFRLEPVLDP